VPREAAKKNDKNFGTTCILPGRQKFHLHLDDRVAALKQNMAGVVFLSRRSSLN
jgi:hypothetical protein